jgi:ribosomal protein S6--L-glutamate ligase
MDARKKRMIGDKLLIGRNEWCQLPELDIPAIKAKIDTGAKTSAIHALNIKAVVKNKKHYVHFDINPLQSNDDILIHCVAPVIDQRYITSSNGHKEHRYVIAASLKMGERLWKIELTLSNRDPLRYRLLLGREALNNRVIIHPGISCNQGKISKKALLKIY